MEGTQPKKAWYTRWWGVTLIIFLLIFLIIVGFIGAVTFNYWQQIKNGGGDLLKQQVYTGFTTETNNTSAFGTITAPSRAELERSDSPYLGSSTAPIVIVEFLDFRCPNCDAAAPIMRHVLEKYGSKIKFIVRHFPVESTHPGASRYAEVSWCAGQQGRFWPVLNYFFDHQTDLSDVFSQTELATVAAATELDLPTLTTCLTGSSAAATAVNRDYVDGAKFGVRGTPTFFINGEKVEGVIPAAVWDSFLKQQ
jgi:protein-disulfide isomerase